METVVQIDPKMRESVNSIKAELGKGGIVCRARQTGKTLALVEFLHEYCRGFAYVVTCRENIAIHLKIMYKQLYPDDRQPEIMSIQNVRNVDGRPRAWVSDEVWPSAVERENEAFKLLTFLGGVGTPMCMDMHSDL